MCVQSSAKSLQFVRYSLGSRTDKVWTTWPPRVEAGPGRAAEFGPRSTSRKLFSTRPGVHTQLINTHQLRAYSRTNRSSRIQRALAYDCQHAAAALARPEVCRKRRRPPISRDLRTESCSLFSAPLRKSIQPPIMTCTSHLDPRLAKASEHDWPADHESESNWRIEPAGSRPRPNAVQWPWRNLWTVPSRVLFGLGQGGACGSGDSERRTDTAGGILVEKTMTVHVGPRVPARLCDISLEDVLAGRHASPMALKDFEVSQATGGSSRWSSYWRKREVVSPMERTC